MRERLRSIAILTTLLCSAWLVSPVRGAGRLQSAPAVLPTERSSNVFFASVTINGSGPFWFTVDTGATLTVIDPGTAQQVGLTTRPAGSRANVDVTGGETEMATTSGARLEIAGLRPFVPDVLYVVPVRGNAGFLGHQVDGVLGTDFLRRYVVEFDYAASRVTVRPPGPASRSVLESGNDVRITVTGNVLIAPAMALFADGTQAPAGLLIDTGSSGALTFTTPFVKRHQLTERFKSNKASATVGISGMVFSPVITLGAVRFGEAVVRQPNASLSQATAGLNASEAFDGIIGAELLRRFTVTVDYPGRRLRLVSAAR
jgi:predicted aspartyl protease